MNKWKVSQKLFYMAYVLYTVFMLVRVNEIAIDNYRATTDYLYSYYWLNPAFSGIVTPNLVLKYLYIIITLQVFIYLGNEKKKHFKSILQMGTISYMIISFTGFCTEFVFLKSIDIQVVNIMILVRTIISFICYQVYFIFIAYFALTIYNILLKVLKNRYVISLIIIGIQYIQLNSYLIRKSYIISRFLPNLVSREAILYAYNPYDISNWAYNKSAFEYANCSLIIDYKNKIIGVSAGTSILIIAAYLLIFIFSMYLFQRVGIKNETKDSKI